MTHNEAVQILEAMGAEVADHEIYCLTNYIFYHKGSGQITLDSDFTPDQLEALLIVMRGMESGDA